MRRTPSKGNILIEPANEDLLRGNKLLLTSFFQAKTKEMSGY